MPAAKKRLKTSFKLGESLWGNALEKQRVLLSDAPSDY